MKVQRYLPKIASFRYETWLRTPKEYYKLHLTVYEGQSKYVDLRDIN